MRCEWNAELNERLFVMHIQFDNVEILPRPSAISVIIIITIVMRPKRNEFGA